MIRVGFTGTRMGMNLTQKKAVKEILTYLEVSSWDKLEFHHGDCIGADSEAHDIAEKIGIFIVVHPPLNEKARAFKKPKNGIVLQPDDYINRNHDIVDKCGLILACPLEKLMKRRSGTWATIRYAEKQKKEVLII